MAEQIKQYLPDGWYLDDEHFVVRIKNGVATGYAPHLDRFVPEKKTLHPMDVSRITEQEAKVQMKEFRHCHLVNG